MIGLRGLITSQNATAPKREEKLKNHMDEVGSCIRLRKHGIETHLVKDEVSYFDEKLGMNQTVSYADLGNGTELKVLRSTSSRNTLNAHLKNTSGKENAKSVIFDNYNNDAMSDENLIKVLKDLKSFHRGRVYVSTKNGKLIRAR